MFIYLFNVQPLFFDAFAHCFYFELTSWACVRKRWKRIKSKIYNWISLFIAIWIRIRSELAWSAIEMVWQQANVAFGRSSHEYVEEYIFAIKNI